MEEKIIIGRNPVLEYLKSIDNPRAELFVSENAHGKIIEVIINEAKNKKVTVHHASKETISSFEPSSRHQGVVLRLEGAQAKAREISEEEIINLALNSKGVLTLLDQLTDPHNVGAIIRTAEALGSAGVVLSKNNSAEINATVVKASAGATAHIPIITVGNVANFLDKAKKDGLWIVGTDENGQGLSKIREYRPCVVIIGSEGSGMRRLTHDKCDLVVTIPMKGRIASLNASVAAGIVLYEALKSEI